MTQPAPYDDSEDAGAEGGREATSIWPHVESHVADLIEQHRSTIVFANSRRLAERLTARLNEIAADARAGVDVDADGPAARPGDGAVGRVVRRRAGDRQGPPRLGLQGAAGHHRGRPQARPPPLRRGHQQSRARHRHGRGRPRHPDRVAAQRRQRPAARRPSRPPGRRGQSRGAVPQAPRRPRADRRRRRADARRGRSSRCGCRPTRSTCWPSRSWRRWPWSRGRSTTCSTSSGARRRSPACRERRSTRPSTCSPAAIPATSSPSCARASSGTASTGVLTGRPGAQRLAVTSGGTIPDRGLFGVFLVGRTRRGPGARVGELDEEMVYESRVGDVFALGATSWRIEDITHDRVLVTPAPGVPGRLPFWKGDALGRPAELGEAIGAFTRELGRQPRERRGRGGRGARPRRLGRRQPRRLRPRAARGHGRRCPATARWSSSGSATSSATGGSSSTRPTARPCTRPGRWRSTPACASATASTARRSPPTTAS